MSRDIIVIGASAGGVEALQELMRQLPRRFSAAVFVVCHIAPLGTSRMAEVLRTASALPVEFATNEEPIKLGEIRVAPPDRHLMLEDGHVILTRGPKHNRARPAIDPLFRSAATEHGRRVVGVVLTGLLDDGAAGLLAIKRQHGVAIVQDPKDARFPDMPKNALAATPVDYCVPLRAIGPLLVKLSEERSGGERATASRVLEIEAKADVGRSVNMDNLGKPSGYSCPECGGVLWEVDDPELLRFRCRVGHSFSVEGLRTEHQQISEDALWAAVRALEESANFSRRLAERCTTQDIRPAAEEYERRAARDQGHADEIASILNRRWTEGDGPVNERQ
ncbi:MAG TPA: chemotaxis protein CheB [Polyangiaceae bacterium]|nr:chemotaxis protein CheB [Polyangiaceae bacterium]